MSEQEKDNAKAPIDSVRRKLLKIGIYSVPTIILLGRVSVARASGGGSFSPSPRQYRKWRRSPRQYRKWRRRN